MYKIKHIGIKKLLEWPYNPISINWIKKAYVFRARSLLDAREVNYLFHNDPLIKQYYDQIFFYKTIIIIELINKMLYPVDQSNISHHNDNLFQHISFSISESGSQDWSSYCLGLDNSFRGQLRSIRRSCIAFLDYEGV